MRRALALLALVAVLTGACKVQKKQPAPKPSKPIIEATVVKLCMEEPFGIRNDDVFCGPNRPDDCCQWRYVKNDKSWPAELPGVGEKLENGRGFPEAPSGTTAVTVPSQGALFASVR